MATLAQRQALAPRPVNDSTPQRPSANPGPSSAHSLKRAREDDLEDTTASRGSAKRSRPSLDNISAALHAIAPEMKTNPLELTPRPVKAVPTIIKSIKQADRPKEDEISTENRQSKKTRAEKEKSRDARLAAEQDFIAKYRRAFPSWRFYFDGVPEPAAKAAAKRVESLGAVIDVVLSKEITHFITPTKVEKEKKNGASQKSLVVPKSTTTLRSPFELKTQDSVDKAKHWGLKIWDIAKLESVLDRTLARPAKTESNTTTQTASQKLALASAAPKNPYGTLGAPKAPKAQAHGSTRLVNHLPPPPRRKNSASASLASLLATEKATNMTLERDPKSRRHDYTYFNKLAAFVIIDSINFEYQGVGRLEFEASKTTLPLPAIKISFGAPSVAENRVAFLAAHKGQGGHLDYPILYMDPRMRSPFQPYNQRAHQRELRGDSRDLVCQEDRQQIIRHVRAHKRLDASLNRTVTIQQLVSNAIATLSAVVGESPKKMDTTAATLDGQPMVSTNLPKDQASGFMRSTANQQSLASMASMTSLSATTGVPTTMSHPTTGFSLSQSGGSWVQHLGAGGIVPNFSGVRHATQVVMNRGAFAAEPTPEPSGAITKTRTVDDLTSKEKTHAGGDDLASIRRTKSLVTVKTPAETQPAPGSEVEKKELQFCECCKQQFEVLSEHVQTERHRKFACDPRRWVEVDVMLKQMRRYRKSHWALLTQQREKIRQDIFAAHSRPLDASESTPGKMFARKALHPVETRNANHAGQDISAKSTSTHSDSLPTLESAPATSMSEGPPSSIVDTKMPTEAAQECEVIDLTASTSDASAVELIDLTTEPGTVETMTTSTTSLASSFAPSEVVEVVFERQRGRVVRKQATPMPDRKWTEAELPSVGSDTPLAALTARGGWTSELEDDEDRRVVLG